MNWHSKSEADARRRRSLGGWVSPLVLLLVCCLPDGLRAATITAEARGATIATSRYRATIRDGALSSFFNQLTREEYLDPKARASEWLPHLPNGLGTQYTPAERTSARALFEWPWWEFPVATNWPNHHFPDAQSKFTFAALDAQSAQLTYRGLSNGQDRFADETFTLEVRVDPGTGDLLLTPGAQSPRAGVYGCGVAIGTLAKAVTVEAPIFEGMRLDRDMQRKLYSNAWPGYWDYGFLALNGERVGAVGLWCEDAELKCYKSLFYRVSDSGLSLSVLGFNVPPFDELKAAKPLTWRLQAFDKSWAQAAARFRAWRLANVKLAPRASWVTNISFMNYGMNKVDPWGIGMLQRYFAGMDLNRVITWAPAVRGSGFDKNHADNTPYATCRADMAAWKSANLRVMAYLQPMIMWAPDPKDERGRNAMEFSKRAMSCGPFLADNKTSVRMHDYHNLGQPDWQRWFLDWVKEYVHDYGFDGIYHDSTYHCSLDVRGLATGGVTAPQGMAQYFYKAATENPGTIHATEHLTEANSVGASLGLGCGIIWGQPSYKGGPGPVGSINWQRIFRASPVANALPGPQSAIVGFPHLSNFAERGPATFHDGMTQMERRGDLPAIPLGRHDIAAEPLAFTNAVNEVWLDRQRALLFVQHGLRATFPEEWDRNALTYFRGADGTEFRYEGRPWGSAFVENRGGKPILHFGRVSGVNRAAVQAGIFGWPCYDEQGPVALDPAVTYCLDPAIARPPVVFQTSAAAVCVREGFADGTFAYLQLQPLPKGEAASPGLRLHAAAEPQTVWVDGEPAQLKPAGAQLWEVPAKANSRVVVVHRELPAGSLDPVANGLACRLVDSNWRRDLLLPSAFKTAAIPQKGALQLKPAGQLINNRLRGESQCHLPLKAPASGPQILRLTLAAAAAPVAWWNGRPVIWKSQPGKGAAATHTAELPANAGASGLLSLTVATAGTLSFDWERAR
jgi:hypothetical protein